MEEFYGKCAICGTNVTSGMRFEVDGDEIAHKSCSDKLRDDEYASDCHSYEARMADRVR